jgi:hypothetical protein
MPVPRLSVSMGWHEGTVWLEHVEVVTDPQTVISVNGPQGGGGVAGHRLGAGTYPVTFEVSRGRVSGW